LSRSRRTRRGEKTDGVIAPLEGKLPQRYKEWEGGEKGFSITGRRDSGGKEENLQLKKPLPFFKQKEKKNSHHEKGISAGQKGKKRTSRENFRGGKHLCRVLPRTFKKGKEKKPLVRSPPKTAQHTSGTEKKRNVNLRRKGNH